MENMEIHEGLAPGPEGLILSWMPSGDTCAATGLPVPSLSRSPFQKKRLADAVKGPFERATAHKN